MSEYFPKPFNSNFADSMSNYGTKQTLKIFLTLILHVLH